MLNDLMLIVDELNLAFPENHDGQLFDVSWYTFGYCLRYGAFVLWDSENDYSYDPDEESKLTSQEYIMKVVKEKIRDMTLELNKLSCNLSTK